jgi:TRAP-type mannitol/chloroaromatic compound transport system permease small subunit
MGVLRFIVRFINELNRVVGGIVAMLVLVLTGLILLEVIFRYGFSSPTVWGTELSTLLFATYVLLGGGYTLLKNDHVRMDIVYSRFSDRGKAVLDLISMPFAMLYIGILFVEGSSMLIDAYTTNRTLSSDWSPLLWPWLLALPVGVGLLALQIISNAISNAVLAFTGRGLE